MNGQNNKGSLEIICGPMFAGKTEELIRRIKRLEYAKKNVCVFKPSIDNRYSENEVVSHSNQRTKSYQISSAKEIVKYLGESLPEAIAIDEVQFLDEEIISIIESLADAGVRVIVAGLDTDFRGEPFSVMPSLLARAEQITKLTAICPLCGEEATRTQRLINGLPASYHDQIVLVGAKESYEPRCRKHHYVLGKENVEKKNHV